MVTWLKPENALRRANELVEVGRKQDALDTLHEVIKNRKIRQWTKVHEQIMLKHLELCVELRKPHLAKDGLFQYRNMCQSVNAKSLEDVIQVFLKLSEKKAEQARQEAQGLVEDVEDLDQAESPEKLLLSVVTGEGSQERADRTILSPWLRFLWEAYRQCLELLRNNIQVETLYHRIAKQAFHFCLEYQRKAEFRKLCDNLRTHLNQIQKAQHLNQTPKGHYALKLTNPETVAFHQETRLVQLDIAIKMELWQEAFKSVEDVHQLMELMHVSKKGVRPAALASYYEKVALIFWKAGSPLYHAAALMKLLQLTKEHKKAASAEELSKLATRVLLAVLSVNASNTCSDLSRHLEMDETFFENQRRLASLIKLPSPPTRQSLLKDAIRFNVPSLASSSVRTIYRLLELDFSPLTLANEVQKQIEILNETAKPEETKYIECLKNVAAAKILRQISQIYSSATFLFLCKIIPYFDKAAIENLIVSMGKRHHFQIRLHHRTDSVEFGLQDQASADDPTTASGDIGSGSGHQNSQLNVPVVQTMPGEQIRQHLQQMYTALQDADACLDAGVHSQKLAESLRNRINLYRFHARDQHVAIMNRKKMIESYKETNERIRSNHEQQQKEQARLLNEQKQREIDQRLQQEKVERLEQQKRREQDELKHRMMQDKLDRMKDPKLRKLIEEMPGVELDHDKILEKQILHLEQEKRETINKLKSQEKKWDYYVRAMHLEEVPLRKEEYEKWAVEDVDHWENYETYRIERAIEEHELLVETVDRMKRMEDDARDIIGRIKAGRQGDFQQKLRDWKKRLSQKREERLAERRRERKNKRREQWLEERRETELRKKEDEERQRRDSEAAGRRGGADAFGKDRYQRRTYDDQQDGEREPSGADADKWVRGQTPFQNERRRAEIPDNQPPDSEPRRPPQSDNWRERNAAAATSQTVNEFRRPDEELRSAAGRPTVPPPLESRAETTESWRRPTTAPVAASTNQPPQVRPFEGAWRSSPAQQPPSAAAHQPPQLRSSETPWRSSSATTTQQPPAAAAAEGAWRRTTHAPPEDSRRETDAWREKPRVDSSEWERGRPSRPEPPQQWRSETRPAAEPENWRRTAPTTGESEAAKTSAPYNAWNARRPTAAPTTGKPSEADSLSSWRK